MAGRKTNQTPKAAEAEPQNEGTTVAIEENTNASGSNRGRRSNTPVPEFSSVDELNNLIAAAPTVDGGSSASQFTRSGFKDTSRVHGLPANTQAVMIGQLVYGLLSNGNGAQQFSMIREWLDGAEERIRQISLLEQFTRIGETLGISRNEGESAEAFIARVKENWG